MKKIWIAIIIIAVIVAAYWWWSSRDKLAQNTTSQVSPNGQTVAAKPKVNDSAQILKGLKGINASDINHELQNINSGQ
jgi:predicted negative regulator of RcsB-dependent stress response